MPSMLQLVQAQLIASSLCSTRVQMTRTTCAVGAAQLVQAQLNVGSSLDPCSKTWHALSVPSMPQLVKARADVMQCATP